MTRVLCPRSSRRKPSNSSQEECQENAPPRGRKVIAKNKSSTSLKENVSPNSRTSLSLSSANSCNEFLSPVRKSTRQTKSVKGLKKRVEIRTDRNVLCDKTNTPFELENVTSPLEQSFELPALKHVEYKVVQKLAKPNVDSLYNNHVPVYKTVGSLQGEQKNEIPPAEKKEAVYEFEVDENDEPIHKKKRKKRVYVKKHKIGPKALTINNIKYSSSESLVSLPERPIARKKKTVKSSKTYLKSFCSVTSLTSTEDTSCSINSFMSQPPSLTLCGNKNTNAKRDLSVLLETQSEESPSLTAAGDQEDSCQTSVSTSSRVSNMPGPSSHNVIFSPNPRCYNSPKTTFLHPSSPCATNVSVASFHDFLSSTPCCKRVSAVVCNNSAFDDSYDSPNSLRQSPGYIRNALTPSKTSLDNYFGFDEPEELEEPLFSPIKNNIDLADTPFPPRPLVLSELGGSKPSTQEVIELLKASIPENFPKQAVSDVFDIESENIDSSPPLNTDMEVVEINLRKPPRRSYERQRRERCHSETQEDSEIEDCVKANDEEEEVKDKVPKGRKKCYKRINTTRSAKPPKVTKAKQRVAKEEEEMERLAAMMNAQFQKIDQVSLVVE